MSSIPLRLAQLQRVLARVKPFQSPHNILVAIRRCLPACFPRACAWPARGCWDWDPRLSFQLPPTPIWASVSGRSDLARSLGIWTNTSSWACPQQWFSVGGPGSKDTSQFNMHTLPITFFRGAGCRHLTEHAGGLGGPQRQHGDLPGGTQCREGSEVWPASD